MVVASQMKSIPATSRLLKTVSYQDRRTANEGRGESEMPRAKLRVGGGLGVKGRGNSRDGANTMDAGAG